jgi:hypothetical protein
MILSNSGYNAYDVKEKKRKKEKKKERGSIKMEISSDID